LKEIAMKQIRNILVIVDPTASMQPALDKAAILALRFKARLELFICDFRAGLDAETADAEGARKILLDHRLEHLNSLAKPLRDAGLDIAIDAVFHNPLHEGLLRKIAQSNADLVVKDTHYHNLVRRTLITNTDWHLIRGAAAPLLLVKPARWAKELCVLAAVDPGHAADKPAALDHAICEWSTTLSQSFGGETHVAHAYFPASIALSAAVAGMPMAVGNEDKLIEAERQSKLQALTALVEPYRIKNDSVHLLLGTAAELLPEQAERYRADVMVMGAIARGRVQRLFIGSTAERILDKLPCDVLIIKPLDFASDLPF
jgi:universal stress protein E